MRMLTQKHLSTHFALFVILLLVNQCKTTVDLGSPFEISGDHITLNITKSNVTKEERIQYFKWVGMRDSFYYSGRTDLFLQLIPYFSPEAKGYYSGIFIFGIVFFILAALFACLLIIYLILRFAFQMFSGPKKYERSFGIITWIIITGGASLSFIALSFAIYNSNQFNSHVQDILSYADAQIVQMQSIYDQMLSNETTLKAEDIKGLSYQATISNGEGISRSHLEQKEKLANFTAEIKTIQDPKFNYEIAYLFFVYLLGIMGTGSYFLRKVLVTWGISFAIFTFSVPATVIIGLNCVYLILSIDFCQNIGKAVINQQAPIDSTGLGVFISCPSEQTMKYLRIDMYEFDTSFNRIYNDLNGLLKPIGDALPEKKRDNASYKALIDKYSSNKDITSRLKALIATNSILAALLSQYSCQTAYSSINYTEEHFCKGAIHYLFQSTMIQIGGVIGAVILAIGINKLIIVINYKNSISLRGNKKYKDDIYNESEDESDTDVSKSRIN